MIPSRLPGKGTVQVPGIPNSCLPGPEPGLLAHSTCAGWVGLYVLWGPAAGWQRPDSLAPDPVHVTAASPWQRQGAVAARLEEEGRCQGQG